MNSHLALLSAQKATKTIISTLHLRPLQLGWLKGISSQSTASEGQTLRSHKTLEFGLNSATC